MHLVYGVCQIYHYDGGTRSSFRRGIITRDGSSNQKNWEKISVIFGVVVAITTHRHLYDDTRFNDLLKRVPFGYIIACC